LEAIGDVVDADGSVSDFNQTFKGGIANNKIVSELESTLRNEDLISGIDGIENVISMMCEVQGSLVFVEEQFDLRDHLGGLDHTPGHINGSGV